MTENINQTHSRKKKLGYHTNLREEPKVQTLPGHKNMAENQNIDQQRSATYMPLVVCQTMQSSKHNDVTNWEPESNFCIMIHFNETVEIHHYCKKEKEIPTFTTNLFKKKSLTKTHYINMCPSEDENVWMLIPRLILDHTLVFACKNSLITEMTKYSREQARWKWVSITVNQSFKHTWRYLLRKVCY